MIDVPPVAEPARARPMLRRVLRGLAWAAAGGLLLVALALGALWVWSGQEGSLAWALQRAAQGQALQVQGVSGSLRGGGRVERLAWSRDGLSVQTRDVQWRWQPLALLQRRLVLTDLRVADLQVRDASLPTPGPPRAPDTLALPVQVRVDRLAIDAFHLQGPAEVQAGRLVARYAYDGVAHALDLQSLSLAAGRYQGEARIEAAGAQSLTAQLRGEWQAPLPGEGASAARRMPMALQAQARGTLRAIEIDASLTSVEASGPRATLTARVTPFEAQPLPAASARLRAVNLALLWPSAPTTALEGEVSVQPTADGAWALDTQLRNTAPGPWDTRRLPLDSLRLQADWRDGRALVRTLDARLGAGQVTGTGDWQAQGGWSFDGRVQTLDPAGLHGALASSPVDGRVALRGLKEGIGFDIDLTAPAAPDARGRLALRAAQARGQWAAATATLQSLRLQATDALLEGQLTVRVAQAAGEGRLRMTLPGLQAQADGALSREQGSGRLTLQASDLARAQAWAVRLPVIGETVAAWAVQGRGEAAFHWRGGWQDPRVEGEARVNGLTVRAAKAASDTPSPPWRLETAQLKLDGRLADAQVALQAAASRGAAQASGAVRSQVGIRLANNAWSAQGRIDELRLQTREGEAAGWWRLALAQPVAWRAAPDDFTFEAGEATLGAPARARAPAGDSDARITWAPLRVARGEVQTQGRITGLPLAWLESLGAAAGSGLGVSGDLVFDARWDARLGRELRLQAELERARGDLSLQADAGEGAATRVAAGLRTARLSLTAQAQQVELAVLWDSERAGRVEGRVRTQLQRDEHGEWSWPAQAALDGRAQARLPRLGVWSVLAPPGWRLRGSAEADLTVSGTRAEPQVAGTLNADALSLRSVVDGVELRHGLLRASFAGRRLVVSKFVLRGAGEEGGLVRAQGEAGWTPQGLRLAATASAQRLRASLREDRQLTVSGPLTAVLDREGLRLDGALVVDRARITLPDETAPRLGEDVIVRGAPGLPATLAQRRARPPPEEGGLATRLAVTVDLGPHFRVAGHGLDTRLAGQLKVEGRSLAQPRVTGEVRTEGGTYLGYGQRMTIQRGELRFEGQADNPALDVLAIRPHIDQRVGVRITGWAQAPRVALYSEGGLSDAETLSWLVLGRSSAGGGAEAALLQRAAAALLAGRGGGRGLAGALGIDDLSVGGEGAGGAVVRVGKRFADNFYAAYESSLNGATGTLRVFYDLTRRITLRGEAGERSGVDLIFTFTD